MGKFHATAIGRRALSAPMRFLRDQLEGRTLDFGCGRGFDADALGMEKHDPKGFPDEPRGPFDTITCIYVLNVIGTPKARKRVEDKIIQLLAPGGRAFISVRDKVEAGSKTQWTVTPGRRWTLVKHVKGKFRIYEHRSKA